MTKCVGFFLVLSLSAFALADNDGDAVNERIPVDKAELEDHWQLNCAAAWAQLQAAMPGRSTNDQCEITPELVREITLCSFIYQAPGDSSQHECPDYRGISQLLKQAKKRAECPELPSSIANRMKCDQAIQ